MERCKCNQRNNRNKNLTFIKINRLDGVSLLIQAGDVDPYKSLRPVFPEYGKEEVDKIKGLEELNDGGAALTAYNYLQYSNITDSTKTEN
ncbi:MAG: hypothetical protein HN427_00035 [Flavobacteriales bacterium]|nr:hypothetical protein [Flavobacteriales bacterium]